MKPTALNSDSASPLYRQLTDRLRRDITAGVYPVHSRIPSEQELCQTYGVSRVTVRKALGELTMDGLLTRHQGKGTFVSIPRIRRDLRSVNSFHDTCRMTGCTPGSNVIHAILAPATDEDRMQLSLPDTAQQVVEIIRLRLADNVPVMLEINHFPPEYQWLLQEELNGSLYALLQSHGVEVTQATHDISLLHAAPAQARTLGVSVGDALLSLHEIIFDQHGLPIHTSQQYIRGDRFTFRI